jgi:hypothetical protein
MGLYKFKKEFLNSKYHKVIGNLPIFTYKSIISKTKDIYIKN